jgi:hypothetical protein
LISGKEKEDIILVFARLCGDDILATMADPYRENEIKEIERE